MFFDGRDIVNGLSCTVRPASLDAVFDLDGGQGDVRRLVFAELSVFVGGFTAIFGKVVRAADWDSFVIRVHMRWTDSCHYHAQI
jgi:hypothetical protein